MEFSLIEPAGCVIRKLNSTDVVDALTDLFILRGPPRFLMSDNVLAREQNAVLGVRSHGIRPTRYLWNRPDTFGIVAQAGSAVKKWSLP